MKEGNEGKDQTYHLWQCRKHTKQVMQTHTVLRESCVNDTEEEATTNLFSTKKKRVKHGRGKMHQGGHKQYILRPVSKNFTGLQVIQTTKPTFTRFIQ